MMDYPTEVDDQLSAVLAKANLSLRLDTSNFEPGGDLVRAFEARMRSLVELLSSRAPSTRKKPVYAYLCEDLRFGAFAAFEKYHYVVVHLGTIPAFFDFFERMMATEKLWPELGDAECEANEPPESASKIKAHAAWSKLPKRQSRNPVRRALAGVLSADCFDFVVFHELAHIFLGHCEYLKQSSGMSRIDDIDGTVPPKSRYLDLQALEVAADSTAFTWGLNVLSSKPDPDISIGGGVDEALQYWHRSPKDAFFHYLLSVFFVFRLFDENVSSQTELLKRAHPPAPFRFQAVCSSAMEYFEATGDTQNRELLTETLPEVWKVGELLFSKTLDREFDPTGEKFVLSAEAGKHQEMLYEVCNNLPRNLFDLSG